MDLALVLQLLAVAAWVVNYAIVALLIPQVLWERRESVVTLAWVFFILLVPFLGLLVFWLLGSLPLRRKARRRRASEEHMRQALDPWIDRSSPAESPPGPLARLGRRLRPPGPLPGNALELYEAGPGLFDGLAAAIDAAQHHVHLEFFIWRPDTTGRRLLERLTAAAQRGVEVRLLLDDVGSVTLSDPFLRDLRLAGGRVERFLPVNLLRRRTKLNFRNHRKLVVVDGWTGFTGGMNVGDEYAGQGKPWRDAHLRLEGPAVLQLQEIFTQDWFWTAREELAGAAYFPARAPAGDEGAWVQCLDSGPDGQIHAIRTAIFVAITTAQERLWAETPYFVPGPDLRLALVSAALRGVDVRVFLPGPGGANKAVVYYAGRSYYQELLAAGVKIHEVPDVMLHSKTLVADGTFAMVGSSNLDQRSLRLDFEVNACVYDVAFTAQVAARMEGLVPKSLTITAEAWAGRSRRDKLWETLARPFAPVL